MMMMSTANSRNAVDDEPDHHEQTRSLLRSNSSSSSADDGGNRDQLIQKAMIMTFKSSAALANLLPTGTVLAFQFLSPIFTNYGDCDHVSRIMTRCLVVLCALFCFISCFTDSFIAADGNVYHGIATIKGFWVLDGEDDLLDPPTAKELRIRFLDFVHAFASVLVFAAMAFFDEKVVNCFYPVPTKEEQEVLSALPVGFGVICSMVFMVFPTKRHGIGYPVTP